MSSGADKVTKKTGSPKAAVELEINGMSCAACARRVEGIPGQSGR